uniref:Plasma membrane ATPase n=1 Tax=Amorphochlora amoebiformis TaxID=1561963 RepID=A0A7S0H6Z2_9EUKA|mmetsp:Transcript_7778/g.12075  ORF Transcript_7778/g.12075 Transcript_7778/m.12075 type:complete len:936 (+) Transcript_7778:1-2808(+)
MPAMDYHYEALDGKTGDLEAAYSDEIVVSETPETGLTSGEAKLRLAKYGYNQLPEKKESLILKFLSFFWGPMPCMIWLAAAVELVQCVTGSKEHYADFAVLLGLQFANGTVAFFEEHNAGNAIAELKASLAPKANVTRDGQNMIINARELVPGDLITLQIGSVIPADAQLIGERTIEVDQAALTGESLPVTMKAGDTAKMGSTVRRGEMDAVVVKTGANTFFGRAAGMISEVRQQGRFQKVLFNVMSFLMGLATVLVIIILCILLVDNGTSTKQLLESIGTAVVILIASIPIAMQVVATVTMAVGAGMLAKKKAIVARLSAIEELAGMHTLCSDKTGTLTLNKLKLDDPIMFGPMSAERLVFVSALAAKRLDAGQDAIDTCITNKALENSTKAEMGEYKQVNFIPFDPAIKRTEATLEHPKEGRFRVTKGAAPQILELCVDRAHVERKVLNVVNNLADRGYRALGVAVTNRDDKFEFAGVLSLFDPPRHDTKATIERAQAMGVQVKMITGDHTAIAIETARRLGMGCTIHCVSAMKSTQENDRQNSKEETKIDAKEGLIDVRQDLDDMILAADGFAEVLPEDKYKIVEVLQNSGQIVGMTGDGVNDAPALKKAEIGIAVEGATDAARAAADIVLTEPGLSVIIDAMLMSRKIFQRVRNYCIYRVAGTIQLIFFFFVAIFFRPSDAFEGESEKNFRLPVLAVVFITLVNDACVLTISRDNVISAKSPQAWHLKEVFIISAVLGFTAVAASICLLLVGFQAGKSDPSGLPCLVFEGCKANYGNVQSAVFLNLCISDIITVFSARTRSWFFTRRPAGALAIAFVFAVCSTSAISLFVSFAGMKHIGWRTAGVIWVYVIVCFLIRDGLKILAYYIIDTSGIIDRQGYLDLVQQKKKEMMSEEVCRKFSQDLVRAVKRSMDATDELFGFTKEIPERKDSY